MNEYILYITKKGDRWDTLAYMFYNNCFMQKPLINANKYIQLTSVFNEGTEILIPVPENTDTKDENLPIWKTYVD